MNFLVRLQLPNEKGERLFMFVAFVFGFVRTLRCGDFACFKFDNFA